MSGNSSLQALVAAAEIQSGTEGAPNANNNANEETSTQTGPAAEIESISAAATPATEANIENAHLAVKEEEPQAVFTEVAQHQQLHHGAVADPVAIPDPTTAPPANEPNNEPSNEPNNVSVIQLTTANPIVPSDVPIVTENPIALDAVPQTANPIIGEDGAATAAAAAATSTANPIVPEVLVNPVADVVTVNPVVPEIATLPESAVPADPTITANAVVASIPAPIAQQHQPNGDTTAMEFSMDVKMEESSVVPAMPVLTIPTSDPNSVKDHEMQTDAAAAERAQQEAIAAAVVANNPPHLPSVDAAIPNATATVAAAVVPIQAPSIPAPPQSGTKPARKRGWVKKTWEERLEELKAYKAVHGDCNVPTICKANPSLGHWVHDQRKQYRLYQNNKQTSMNPLRIAQLEEVGFKWALQRHTTMRSWAERFAQLEGFKRDNGHCNVPIRYKVNPSLGQWVSTQRQEYSNYRNGKKSNMTQDRITKLEAAEFCWSLRDTAKMAPRKSWDMHFAALKEFKKENGHCDVRVRSKQNPTGSLGRWVEKQRSQYHSRNEGKDSKLTQDQIDKLDGIGFKWRIRHERNKISGCARNPDLKIDDEAMMDDYTKRALDERARNVEVQVAVSQVNNQVVQQTTVQVTQEQLQQMNHHQHQQVTQQHQEPQLQHHMVHDPQLQEQQMQHVVHDPQMQAQPPQLHEHQQMPQHAHPGQMDAQMEVQIEPEPIKVDNTMDGTVQVAIEPMSIETAAAVAAVEGIPIEAQPQTGTIPVHVPIPGSVPAPVPVAMPIHETMEEAMTHEV